MRNLNKVLALCLALTMAFGLMISAAAFTDDKDIVNKDAAELLTQLKIISGFPDGSFQPAGVVTRAQMAKMTYVAMRKGVDDGGTAFVNANVPLTDIGYHWAKGYIKYAYGAGIIAGFPDGSFKPDASVTGTQAAKMLLTALGYKSDVQGYAGTGWDFKVGVDAANAGLLEDIEDVDLSQPLSRDNAAQMIYNAIFANTVTYEDGVLTEGKTFAEAKLGLLKITGILMANDEAGLGTVADDGYYTIKGEYDDTNAGDETYDVKGDADLSLVGEEVNAYVKIASDVDDTNELKEDDIIKTYGKVVATDNNNVIVDYDADWTPDDDYTVDSDVVFSVNYGLWTKNAAPGANEFNVVGGALTLGTGYTATKGDKKIYIDNNDDDKFDVIIALDITYGEATVKSSAETIKVPGLFGTSKDFDDVLGADAIKDGEKVLGFAFASGSSDYDYCVYAAPSFDGTLTAKTSGGSLRISGSSYSLSDVNGSIGDGGTDVDDIYDNSDNRGTELTYYTDGKYIVDYSGSDSTAVANDYCAIREVKYEDGFTDAIGSFDTPHKVSVTLADGTEKIYPVKSAVTAFTTQAEFQTAYLGAIVPYTLDDDEIELGAAITTGAGATTYYAGRTSITAGGTNYSFTTSSVVFARSVVSATEYDFDVYTGKANTPDITAVGGVVPTKTGETDIAVLLATTYTATEDDGNIAVLVDYEKLYNSDNDAYYELYLYEGGSKLTTLDTDPDDFSVTGTGAHSLTSAKLGCVVDYTISGGLVTELDVQAITEVDSSLAITDSTDGYYVGYAYDYAEGDTITLRPSHESANTHDYTFDLDSDCYSADLVEADSGSVPELDVDPTTDDDDIASADDARYNVIVKVEDGLVTAIWYFSNDDFATVIA